jgi:hypothetical protein
MNNINHIEEVLYKIIKFEFPKIKDLKVKYINKKKINVSFTKGKYTSQQIINKINEYKAK